MDSRLERISSIECRIHVEMPWAEVAPKLEQRMRDLRGRARLPGFRPGKIPSQVLERMFGKGVRQELARDLVQETFQTCVTQHQTIPLTQPVLESSSLEREAPFTYAARFEVPPLLEPKDYVGVEVRRRPVAVADALVDEEIEKKREALAELRAIEGDRKLTQPGDVWTVDIEGAIGETRVARKDVKVEIGGKAGTEFIPGLSDALAQTELSAVGSTREVRFTPPQERLRPELRGHEAVLTLGLREVKARHLPALDDEFARDTAEAESLQELRDKVQQQLVDQDKTEAEIDARRRLVTTLLERNAFDPAPSMVSREVAAQADMTRRQLAQQGMSLAQLGLDENTLKQRIRPQALFNVKAYLLLDAIGKKEGIDVDDAAFEAGLEEMAKESGQNLSRMRAQMDKNGQLILLRAQMREEKILDFLMEKAQVTEAPDPGAADVDGAVEDAAAKLAATDEDATKGSRRKRRSKASSGESSQDSTAIEGASEAADD